MRVLLTILLVAAVLVGAAPGTVHAASEVKISGVVLDQRRPVAGIIVQVECWTTGFVVRPVTNSNGAYSVITNTLDCPLGTTLKVRSNTALNAKVGFKFSTVQLSNELNIDLIDMHGVPEYGRISGIMAAGVGIGCIAFVRRRYGVCGGQD